MDFLTMALVLAAGGFATVLLWYLAFAIIGLVMRRRGR